MTTVVEYLPAEKALWWLAKWCEEPYSLVLLEQAFEACEWIPLQAFQDQLSSNTIQILIEEVGVFTAEDINKLNTL